MVEEIHLIRPPDFGHHQNCTCWCEPQVTRWQDTVAKKQVVLIIHYDADFAPRGEVLFRRLAVPDYVTRLLNSVGSPTRRLARRRRKGKQ